MCSKPQPVGFKECPCTHTDPEKRLYNQVLTELIEQRFYGLYLPNSAQSDIENALNQQFPPSNYDVMDTATNARSHAAQMQLQAVQQNRLFNDSAHFKTVYLDTTSRRGLNSLLSLHPIPAVLADLESSDSSSLASYHAFYFRLNEMVANVAPKDKELAVGMLNTLQRNISSTDFQLCTAKVETAFPTTSPPAIGYIRFSKIVFNATQTKALLRYDWHCGGNCGRGELLLMEKTNGNWHIKQAEMLWIS